MSTKRKVVLLLSLFLIGCVLGGIVFFTIEKKAIYATNTVPSFLLFPRTADGRIAYINFVSGYVVNIEGDNPYVLHSHALVEVYDTKNGTKYVMEDPFVVNVVIDGNILVVTDHIVQEPLVIQDKVFLYLLEDNKKEEVMERVYDHRLGHLRAEDISENHVLLWEFCDTSGSLLTKLYVFDIKNQTTDLVDESPGYLSGRIDEGRIVYLKEEERNIEIWLYNVKNKERSFTGIKGNIRECAIYKNTIVYITHENNFYTVYAYDLNNKKETKLLTGERKKFGISLWEDKIVWEEVEEGVSLNNWRAVLERKKPIERFIVLYDLKENKREELYKWKQSPDEFSGDVMITAAFVGSPEEPPQISDNIVVWQETTPEYRGMRIRYIDLRDRK